MENNILTPTQLWMNYDPYSEPLRPSYLDFVESEEYYKFEAYINGDTYNGETVRIYIQGCTPKNSSFNSNIITIGDASFLNFDATQLALAKSGYGVFLFNYAGKTNASTKYTRYPKSVDYANYINAGDHLYKAEPSAKDTSIYEWCKVCRKVISFVKQTRGIDSQILLTGYKLGADIAWQVAAMDKRVDGIAAMLNAGWKEYRYIPKLSNDIELNFSDERKRWFTGCATQSYIKFINCPVLCLNTTNSSFTSFDRLIDTFRLLEENHTLVTLNISAGLSNSVTKETQKLYAAWLYSMSKKISLPSMPRIILNKTNENQLVASLDIDKAFPIEKITVHYSYDELDSTLRSWSYQIVSQSGLKTYIPVYDTTQTVFAYASVEYKGGYEISSIPTYIHTTSEENYDRTNIKKSRIIYQKSFGTNGWVVDQDSNFFDVVEPKIEIGDLGIAGITCSYGDLSTYTIGEYKYKSENQNLLQFDAYSKIVRSLTICICSGERGLYDYYYANIVLPENKWTKCSLKLTDFKNSNLVPLKEWGFLKKLTFKDANDTLFNNIIWV